MFSNNVNNFNESVQSLVPTYFGHLKPILKTKVGIIERKNNFFIFCTPRFEFILKFRNKLEKSFSSKVDRQTLPHELKMKIKYQWKILDMHNGRHASLCYYVGNVL